MIAGWKSDVSSSVTLVSRASAPVPVEAGGLLSQQLFAPDKTDHSAVQPSPFQS